MSECQYLNSPRHWPTPPRIAATWCQADSAVPSRHITSTPGGDRRGTRAPDPFRDTIPLQHSVWRRKISGGHVYPARPGKVKPVPADLYHRTAHQGRRDFAEQVLPNDPVPPDEGLDLASNGSCGARITAGVDLWSTAVPLRWRTTCARPVHVRKKNRKMMTR